MPSPRYPFYLPTKGRAQHATTPRVFDQLGIDYHLIVEEPEAEAYASAFPRARILILDPAYQRDYDALMELEPGASRGSGPARNFAWDHAAANGAAWHWTVDDNIRRFYRLNRNQRIPLGDGTMFAALEDFVDQFDNVAMAGPHYSNFSPPRNKFPPFLTNTRVYSCNLIRTDLPFRWRGRYNEDVDLSLVMLKAGW